MTMIVNGIVGNHIVGFFNAFLFPKSHPIIVGRLRVISGKIIRGGSGGRYATISGAETGIVGYRQTGTGNRKSFRDAFRYI